MLAAESCLHHEAVLGCLALLSGEWKFLLINISLVGLNVLCSGNFLLRRRVAAILGIFLLFDGFSAALLGNLWFFLALGGVSNGAWDVAWELRITDMPSWESNFLLWVELATDFALCKLLIWLVAN